MIITPSISPPTAFQGAFARTIAANITSNEGRVGWVSSSPGRSTSDILWSCFSILLVCAWKCIHFNVPSNEERDAGWHKLWHTVPYWPERLLWWRWSKTIGFIITIILAPEIGVAIAMDQHLFARESQEGRDENRKENVNEGERVKEDSLNGGTSEGKVVGEKEGPRQIEEGEKVKEDSLKGGTSEGKVVEERPKQTEEDKILEKEGFVTHELYDSGFYKNPSSIIEIIPRRREISKTHAFLANMGGLRIKIVFPSHQQKNDEITRPLELLLPNWKSLDPILDKFPGLQLMHKEEIDDVSKADIFAKLFACVQSIWLVAQSIARVSVGLPITELELATIALVFCALIMYVLWWNKPFGVERPVTIYATYDSNIPATIAAIKRASSLHYFNSFANPPSERHYLECYFAWRLKTEIPSSPSSSSPPSPPPDLTFEKLLDMAANNLEDAGKKLVRFEKALGGLISNVFGKSHWIPIDRDFATCITFYGAGTLFSAFHLGAWQWDFPTSTIRTIWRSFALAATGTGPLAVVVVIMPVDYLDHLGRPLRYLGSNMKAAVLCLLLAVYILARLGLIVLVFYCFSSMPAAVYQTVNWAQFLPHFT
ncbi:hypothetical protein B0O99DRAFT_694672 [Bisporella sp. PMI_857]|nr:hypothetical protein B0O99DRAFT_694672 [Bisporella sp. PMI_857]